MNNTAYFSLPHVLRNKKIKKIKFLSAIPYDTFFSPFHALVHVEVHVFP